LLSDLPLRFHLVPVEKGQRRNVRYQQTGKTEKEKKNKPMRPAEAISWHVFYSSFAVLHTHHHQDLHFDLKERASNEKD
jgi:hypothetical protein